MDNQQMSQTDFQKLMLLLAEKRTAHTTLRSGIALCAFSITIISFILLMTSKVHGVLDLVIFIALGTGSILMLALGIYFIRRGFTRMRFQDGLINQILFSNSEAGSLFYHTRERNNFNQMEYTMRYDVVFHLDNNTTDLGATISSMENYFKRLSGKKFHAHLVVDGAGIKFLGKNAPHAVQLTRLSKIGLQIQVCQNAIDQLSIEPAWLIPSAKIVPSGLLEIIDLQRKGFAYIKP